MFDFVWTDLTLCFDFEFTCAEMLCSTLCFDLEFDFTFRFCVRFYVSTNSTFCFEYVFDFVSTLFYSLFRLCVRFYISKNRNYVSSFNSTLGPSGLFCVSQKVSKFCL